MDVKQRSRVVRNVEAELSEVERLLRRERQTLQQKRGVIDSRKKWLKRVRESMGHLQARQQKTDLEIAAFVDDQSRASAAWEAHKRHGTLPTLLNVDATPEHLSTPVSVLEVSVRARAAFRQLRINTLGELAAHRTSSFWPVRTSIP
jgi:hypothetical protein